MPSITIRFDWDQPVAGPTRQTLRDIAHGMVSIAEQHTGEVLYLGERQASVDELTIDAIVDDGHGITAADRADAELGAELDGKAAARAAEYDEHHAEEA